MKINRKPGQLASLRNLRRSGFTLMELMLVLGIISILIVAGVRIGPAIQNQAKIGAAKADIGTLSGFLISYQSTHSGRLPASIKVLVDKGVITEAMSTDPWGNPYQLVVPAKRSKDKFDLFSQGKTVEDESDDVGNWDE
jgi:general secretion pathway protein G